MNNFFYNRRIQKLNNKALKGNNRVINKKNELKIIKQEAEKLNDDAVNAFKTLFTREKIEELTSFIAKEGHPEDRKDISIFLNTYANGVNPTLINTFFKYAKMYNKPFKKHQRIKKGV